ncbi:hypothetical protein TNCV_2412231 [Trichonephila clavipes]|nr:hypothetical protein TNCV_2412231 [Trichonephila clavipes]
MFNIFPAEKVFQDYARLLHIRTCLGLPKYTGDCPNTVIPRLTLPRLNANLECNANFKYFVNSSFSSSPITKIQSESVLDPDEIDSVIEVVVYLAKQINLQVDSDDFQELLICHNQRLTIDEIIEMQKREQNFEEETQFNQKIE